VIMNEERSKSWRNVFTGEQINRAEGAGNSSISVAEVLRHFPVALLSASVVELISGTNLRLRSGSARR
jgi:maltooligosyltrehalose synthase